MKGWTAVPARRALVIGLAGVGLVVGCADEVVQPGSPPHLAPTPLFTHVAGPDDNTRIWFRDGEGEIHVMRADGSEPRRVTFHPAEDYEPSASPDGRRVAFVSDRDGLEGIYVMNADGSEVRRLTTLEGAGGPRWSPDGSQLVFSGIDNQRSQIFVINADGANQRQLTAEGPSGDPSSSGDPTWSPDGAQVAFWSSRDGNIDIYVMNADGSTPRRLTMGPWGESHTRPAWSPDGTEIAFQHVDGQIYAVNAEGGEPRRVTTVGGRYPSWSPDGSSLTYYDARGGTRDIYVANADGTDERRLTQGEGLFNRHPAWAMWPNQPPAAALDGSTYAGLEGAVIALDGGNSSDPDGDLLSFAWDFGDGTGGAGVQAHHAYADNGLYQVTLTVSDGVYSTSAHATATIANVPPTARLSAPESVNDGDVFTVSLVDVHDPSSADVAAGFAYAFDCGDGLGYQTPAAPGIECPTQGVGTLPVRGRITDKDGGLREYSMVVTVLNVAPTATFAAQTPVEEGAGFTISLSNPQDSPTDTEAGFTYAFDCGDGAGFGPFGTDNDVLCPTSDNGSRTAGAKIRDQHGAETAYVESVIVVNVAPSLGAITAALEPQPTETAVSISAPYSDPGALDTHFATVDWGDGFVVDVPVDGGTATASHVYAVPGVYRVRMRVTDDDGGTSNEGVFEYVVIYDPESGFVTGGGWIASPAGAYVLDPGATGKATFGFVAKYLKGANTPVGNTEFQFHAAGLAFKSTAYDWLVVAGGNAKIKGTGTINDGGAYNFMLTAVDAQATGGGPDRFRIKIWDQDGGVVYDNQLGAADDSDVATALGGGSIVIHRK